MKYTAVGEEVSVEACIVQTTAALDAAGALAQRAKDVKAMLRVAQGWTKLADFMAAVEQSRQETIEPEKKPFGFHHATDDDLIKLAGSFEIPQQLEIDFEEEDEDVRDNDR